MARRKKGTRIKTPVQQQLSKANALLSRDLPGAILIFGKVLEKDPENPRALTALRNLTLAQRRQIVSSCESLAKIGAAPHALALIHIVRRANPGDPQFAVFEALTHIIEKDFKRGAEVIEPLIAVHHDNKDVQITYGTALAGLHESEKAIAILQPYFHSGHLSGEAANALAVSLTFLGRNDEARDVLLTSARRRVLSATGLYGLSRNTDITQEPEILEHLVSTFSNENVPLKDRELAAFSLANAHEQAQDYDTAFEFLAAANRMKPDTEIAQDMAEIRKIQSQIQSVTTRLSPPQIGPQIERQRPVFIVGVPRSGTTLTEQILARHSKVQSLGESRQLGRVLHQFFNQEAQQICPDAVRNAYLEVVPESMRNSPVILDKMPFNAFLVELILKAIPDARIVHCRRHPMACSFSAFQIRFASGHTYSHRFDTIAEYYRLSEGTVARWTKEYPDRVMPVFYEALTEAPEHWIEELVRFCGLDLEDGLTDYRGSTAPIHTASVSQVRRRIYRGSSDKWKNYADHLVPLTVNLIEDIARYEVELEHAMTAQMSMSQRAQSDSTSSAA